MTDPIAHIDLPAAAATQGVHPSADSRTAISTAHDFAPLHHQAAQKAAVAPDGPLQAQLDAMIARHREGWIQRNESAAAEQAKAPA
jgi:hypothetical protein